MTSIQNIKQNQSQIKKLDSLDSYKSLASIWIHEWTHLFLENIIDQPAYDAYSNRVPNQKTYGFGEKVRERDLFLASAAQVYFARCMQLRCPQNAPMNFKD